MRTAFKIAGEDDLAWLEKTLREMADDIAALFKVDGVDPLSVKFARSGELRYAGQGYELKVPLPEGALDGAAIEALADDRPDDLAEAFEAARDEGPKWRERLDSSLNRMPDTAARLSTLG